MRLESRPVNEKRSMEDEDEAERLINPAISDVESSKRKTRKEKAHSSKGKRDNAIQGSPPKENRI